MHLPKTIRVGGKKYWIRTAQAKRMGHYGTIYYGLGTIVIHMTDARGKAISPEKIGETFWHEITHAVLHDMGHKLHSNEAFVDAFSKRLNSAILSARF